MLDGWGDHGALKEDELDIRKWLHEGGVQEMITIPLTTTSNTNPTNKKKLSQLELDCGGTLKRNERSLNETVPEGWKPGTMAAKVQRKMTRKQLAKSNTKMTSFLMKPSPSQDALEEVQEIESGMKDTAALQRQMVVSQQDKIWRNARMVTALLKDLVNEVPGRGVAMSTVNLLVDSTWGKLLDRVRAREAVTGIMDEMVDKAWWKFRVENVWNIIRNEKDIQKVMIWRIDNQRQEERLMVNFRSRQERLHQRDEAKRKWRERRLDELDSEQPMELGFSDDAWKVQEEQEHAAMDGMMATLELNDDMVLEDEPDGSNPTMDWSDAMDHEYLDRLLAEAEVNTIRVDLPANEPDVKSNTGDKQSGWQEGVQGTMDNNIDERAYRSGGTWWLRGWI